MKFPILFVQTGFIVAISYKVELNRIKMQCGRNLPNHNTQLSSVCPPTLQRFLLRCFWQIDSSLMTKPSLLVSKFIRGYCVCVS